MITLFENSDFILKSTGHDYDFVGIIENKNNERLTFFFDEDTDVDGVVYEDMTKLLGVYANLETYDEETDKGWDEAQDVAERMDSQYGQIEWLTTRDDGCTGFMSDCKERGWFLALIKAYCPEKLSEISWA